MDPEKTTKRDTDAAGIDLETVYPPGQEELEAVAISEMQGTDVPPPPQEAPAEGVQKKPSGDQPQNPKRSTKSEPSLKDFPSGPGNRT